MDTKTTLSPQKADKIVRILDTADKIVRILETADHHGVRGVLDTIRMLYVVTETEAIFCKALSFHQK
jgi:hypothetical protein